MYALQTSEAGLTVCLYIRNLLVSDPDLPDFFLTFLLLTSAGKRDLHIAECCKEFVGAETSPAAAAGGGQCTGGLHWCVCVRVCV